MTWSPETIVQSFCTASRLPAAFRTLRIALCLLALAGCRQEMYDQPRYEPLEQSTFFADGRSARPLEPNTVARGQLRTDEHLTTGKTGGAHAETFPFLISRETLMRGQERYNIFCSPCHDRVGRGQGMVVHRGFARPASFHGERLRQAPAGYFFDAITNGFGVMPSYASQITVEDRWAIVAYIRALQLSQRATLADVPAEVRKPLREQAR